MGVEDLVNEIVATYELDQKLGDKIARIAARRANEIGAAHFDNLYTMVAELVELFQTTY